MRGWETVGAAGLAHEEKAQYDAFPRETGPKYLNRLLLLLSSGALLNDEQKRY
jgi:hypothetical protein